MCQALFKCFIYLAFTTNSCSRYYYPVHFIGEKTSTEMCLPKAHDWEVAEPRLRPRQWPPEHNSGPLSLTVTFSFRQTWAQGGGWLVGHLILPSCS